MSLPVDDERHERAIKAASAARASDLKLRLDPEFTRIVIAAYFAELGERLVPLAEVVEFVAATMNEHLAHAINCHFRGGER